MKTRMTTVVSALAILLSGLTARAEEAPGPLAVVADAAVVRPACLAVTIVGSALFVATLPFSAASKSIKPAARALIGVPAHATFTRPMGDLDALEWPEQDQRQKQSKDPATPAP